MPVRWSVMLLALAQASSPVIFTTDIRPQQPQVGQTIELRVIASWPGTVSNLSPRFDTWTGPFEVVQIDAGTPASAVGDRTSATWQIRLRTFDLGQVRIPGIPFDFQQLGLRERQSARTDDFVVESLAPAVEAGASIRPLEDVVEPRIDVVDIAVAGATGALVLLAVVWLTMRLAAARRRRTENPVFSSRKALRELERARRGIATDAEPFYAQVSRTTRRFLETAFRIPGAVLSSTELVVTLSERLGPGSALQQLTALLTTVDAVRFGGKTPTDADNRTVFELIRSLLLNRELAALAKSRGRVEPSRQ
jgi:hypothetical protein